MRSLQCAILLLSIWMPAFVLPCFSQSIQFTPSCSVVYRDTLFIGGRTDRDNPTFPLVALGDGQGRPFESPMPFSGPVGQIIESIDHLAVFQGGLLVVGTCSREGQAPPIGGMFVYDRWWSPLPVQPPWKSGGITDVLVSGGALYLAGRFKDPETGVTENVLVFDGCNWHKLGLQLGWQYITRLCEYEGMVIAAAGVRSRELNEDYLHQEVLTYAISSWDGSSWITIKEDKGGMPEALTVFAGDLYVGFNTIEEAGPHPSVLKYDGQEWSSVGAAFRTGNPRGFVKLGGLGSYRGKLVAVGNFDRIAGFQVPGAAYLSGNTWRPLGLEIKGWPRFLATFGHTLWVGQLPGISRPRLVFWDEEIPVDVPMKRVVSPVVSDQRPPVEVTPFCNGDFSERDDGVPVGWAYEFYPMASLIRAEKGDWPNGDSDTLSFSPNGGVIIPPQPNKGSGRRLKQEFPAEKGKSYRARVRARFANDGSEELRAGTFSLSVGHSWDRIEITDDDFRWYQLELPASDRSFSGKISFSGGRGGGYFEIAEVQLEEHDLDYAAIYEAFCQDFSRKYANLKYAPVDWDSLLTHWRPIASDARDCIAFHNIIGKMLAELKDPQLMTETRSSDVIARRLTYSDPAEEARRREAMKRAKPLYRDSPLRDGVRKPPEAEFVEVDGHQILYLSVTAVWHRVGPELGEEFLAEASSAEGFLLDLRGFNSERMGVWGENKLRVVKKLIDDLPEVPKVALINPTTKLAGADCAIALKDKANVTFVGLETGTPSQTMDVLRAGCGFQVHLPSYQVELSDGSIVDGRHGLVPDVPVVEDWESEKDEIREEGIKILLEQLGD